MPNEDFGPTLAISQEIHQTKYRARGENFREAMNRVADALKDSEEHYHEFRDILLHMRFMPAGRVQTAMGSPRQTTPYNCFSGDTNIITINGVQSLAELAGQWTTLVDGNGEWTEAFVHEHMSEPTKRVRLTNGRKSVELFATPNHEWIVEGEENRIKTSDLKIGSRVPHSQPVKYAAPLGVVHGLVYGDGTRTKDNGYVLHVCANHQETYSCLEDFPFSETERGRLYYFFGDNAFTEMKKLPDNVLLTPDWINGFIRGLFLADGCISTQPEIIITGTIELYDWLVKYGPMAGWYVTGKSKLSTETNFGVRTRDTYNIRFDYRSIFKEDLLKNSERLSVVPSGWRVAEISSAEVMKVYCPSVPTTRSFLSAEGILLGNCFVSGIIEDNMDSIMARAADAAQTMRLGGGIGYDFSRLRPRGDLIRSLDSRSSGPVSFMGIFDAICKTIASAGHRRGAQMGVLRVDHPDIEEFIEAKANSYNLTQFNISVGVTDDFMSAVKNDEMFDLKFEGRTYRTIRAKSLWDKILRHTWDWAEPGILFIDRINQKNNLWYCETIEATNPCGEQPLPEDGACLLGSFNLTKYIIPKTSLTQKGAWQFDYEQFKKDIPIVVRAMDNVIDRAIYPLPKQEREAKDKRRMGLGLTGVANAIEVLGAGYGSEEFLAILERIMTTLRDTAYETSIELSKEKGCFPLFEEALLESAFARTLPEHIREAIRIHGLRNSHLLSIAPTGTISLSADNVSSGIEPVFSLGYNRTIQTFEGPKVEKVEDYGYRVWNVEGCTAGALSVFDHVRVLNLASRFVDSACSKTCNVGDDVTWEQFKDVYMRAYDGGASGCTTFRASGKRFGILQASAVEDVAEEAETQPSDFVEENIGGACYFDPNTGIRTCDS